MSQRLFLRRAAAALALACHLLADGFADPLTDMSLRAAISDGRREEAIQLVEAGADLNGRTSGGYTPLMIAAGVGDEAMVRLLLERGADPTLLNDSGWSASYLAKINNFKAIQQIIDGATRGAGTVRTDTTAVSQPQVGTANTGKPPLPSAPPNATWARQHDSRGWPTLGAYRPGDSVLYSGTAGKTWLRGSVKSLDPTYGYNFEGVTGSTDAYFVVGAEREPFWTDWFVGDWQISVPMAMNVQLRGDDLYRVVSGGLRLPPLRISKDGSYSWRFTESGKETVLRGTWEPNPEGPGVILKNAAHGADWLVYNNSRSGSTLGQTVILSTERHTYYDGSRLK